MKDLISQIRELTKSNKFQTIFANEKQIGLKLFKNDYDYSDLQITFLNYLLFHYSIAMDIAMGDVDKRVNDDPIYEDSYIIYKNKEKKEEMKETMDKKKGTKNTTGKPEKALKTQFIFRKPKGSTV